MKLKVFISGICFLILPLAVLAATSGGLVPCGGIGQPFCSFCDLFKLIGNVFQFIVGTLVPIIAVAMAVWGGYKILTAGFNPDQIKSARQMLYNTFIGLIIVYGSFVAVSYIVGFFAKSALKVDYGFHGGVFTVNCTSNAIQDVRNVKLELKEKPYTVEKISDVSADQSFGANVKRVNGVDLAGVNGSARESLITVADSLKSDKGITLLVTDGLRSLNDQQAIAQEHCVNPTANTCEAKPGKSAACIPKGDGGNCPHVSGKAVDVWGWQNGKQCSEDSDCQKEVIKTMRAKGFCNLIDPNEPWHFEKPPRPDKKNCS